MTSTFFGFNIAKSGLFASQRALHVTGHNIANANTPGFSRQRLNVTQSDPMYLPNGQGMLGAGVDTDSIQQIRDAFLDFKIRKENSTFGEWETRSEALQQIEAIFNEPSESGIRQAMDEFFTAWSRLSQGDKADNLTVRAEVRQRGVALTDMLNHMYNQLEQMQENIDFSINTTVEQINGYAEQIAALNKQIFENELGGNKANDLRDQRNLLIDELSKLVDIQVQEVPVDGTNGAVSTMRIIVQGMPIVNHFRYEKLNVTPRTGGSSNGNYVDVPQLLDITWANGSRFDCQSGKLKGLLDIRDNMLGGEKGIPYYMDRLNRFTTVFAARFNMQHQKGYGLSGAGTGKDFFNVPGTFTPHGSVPALGESDEEFIKNYEESTNYAKTLIKDDSGSWYEVDIVKANQIAVSTDVMGSLNVIAAATYDDGSGNALEGDGSNAQALYDLRHDTSMFTWGKPDDFFKSLISNLGVDAQGAIRMTDNQQVLIHEIENRRQSTSGVSLDEEMANMVKFQHAYNASARMITTIDEMLDKMINGMGVVGR